MKLRKIKRIKMTKYPKRFEGLYNAYKDRAEKDLFYNFYRLGYNDCLKEVLGKVKNDKKE